MDREGSIYTIYFNWMLNKIFHDENLKMSYYELLCILNSIVYEWILEMDENRQKDAQDLRYLFGNEYGLTEAQICQELDILPPSLLEVIVALINRVQETILYDPDKLNSNQEIFMDILTNLGLNELTGHLTEVDTNYIWEVIVNFYHHNYSYFGEGGMFVVQNPKADMRETEIWYQCMWYLDEKQGGKYL